MLLKLLTQFELMGIELWKFWIEALCNVPFVVTCHCLTALVLRLPRGILTESSSTLQSIYKLKRLRGPYVKESWNHTTHVNLSRKKTIVGCGIEIPGLTCQCMNCLYFPSPKGLKKARLLLAAKKHGITAKHPCPTLHDHEGMGICKVHVFHFRTIKVTQAQAMLWRSSHLRSQSADCQTFNPSLVWVAHHPKCGAYYPFLRLSKNTCKLLCKPLSPSVGAYLRVFSVRPPALAG